MKWVPNRTDENQVSSCMINVLNYTDQCFNTSQYNVNKSSENRPTKKELHFTIKITKSIKI